MERCKRYLGVSCIDGNCPVALMEEYGERVMPIVDNCDDCHLYGGCDDCAWDGTRHCPHSRGADYQNANRLLR